MRYEHLKASNINKDRIKNLFEENRDRWITVREISEQLGILPHIVREYCHKLCRSKVLVFKEARREYPSINGVRQVRRMHEFCMPNNS
jgi:Mn-dependent DtxR family transcriptional regulator